MFIKSQTDESNEHAPQRGRRVARYAAALAVTAGAVLTPVLLAQPAFALPGQTSGQAQSANDTSPVKVVTAKCPTGTVATGGSAVIGGTTDARVNTTTPDATGYTVLATAPRGGLGGINWLVVATANCVSPPAGLQYRSATSAFDSATNHKATATCDPGKQLIGMGGSINTNGPGQDQVGLVAVRADSTRTSVVADAYEDRFGFGGNWNIAATAVCANPVPGLNYPSTGTAIDSVDAKSARATCATGTRPQGGGFDVSSARGLAFVSEFYLSTSDPAGPGFVVNGHEDRNGFTGDWRVLSQAVCAS